MAYDKVVDSTVLDNGLTAIAGAVRTKGGTSAQLSFPTGIVNAINAIPSGGSASKISLTQDDVMYSGTSIYIKFPVGTDINKIVAIHVPCSISATIGGTSYLNLQGTFDIIGYPTIGDGISPGLNTSWAYRFSNRNNTFTLLITNHSIGTDGTGHPVLILSTPQWTITNLAVDTTYTNAPPYAVIVS